MVPAEILQQYRPNIGICLFNKEGQVWLGQRYGMPAHNDDGDFSYAWQMPQGGIDKCEEIESAAHRELWEETGAKSVRLLTITPGWLCYDFPAGYKRKNWKGQRQKWAAMLFEGDETEFDLTAHGEQEFEDWRWASLDEAVQSVVPFKAEVYTEIIEAFKPLSAFLSELVSR